MRATVALLASLCLLAAGRPARAELPVFDAHVHYNAPDSAWLGAAEALALLERAGVRRAIVSSTPDEGTVRLYERSKGRIVPFVRPYLGPADLDRWYRDEAAARFVEERLESGIYRGIGELHLPAAAADAPVMRRFAELAVARDLFLHLHTDEAGIERVLALYPRAKVLWAHAGLTAKPAAVGRLLARSPRLWVELSSRADIAPGGTLDPEWRRVLVAHPDRFLVGTDTWVTERWRSFEALIRATRAWLAELPAGVALRIAYRNADELFPPW